MSVRLEFVSKKTTETKVATMHLYLFLVALLLKTHYHIYCEKI